MKNILISLLLAPFISTCFAMGPNEIMLNGTKFIKNIEKSKNNTISAEYSPANGNSSESIIITHVLDKNDPSQIASGLKGKKSIEVVDVDAVKEDRSDMLVTFVKFDLPNLKVQNNLCRIVKSANNGSIVFQYVDTKRLKSSTDGATFPDFTQVSENLKQLPIEKYSTTLSQTQTRSYEPNRNYSYDNLPWYKRPNARAGVQYYPNRAPTGRNTIYR